MGKRRGILSLALLVLCFSLCYLGVPASVSAIEPGTAAMYPGGNEDFFAGALPPAGTKVFINYLTYYDSTQANGNSGHQAQINFGGKLGVQDVDLRLQTLVDAMRFVDVTKVRILGGDLVWHVIVPVQYLHASLAAGPVDIGTGTMTALGDVEFGAGIAWHPSKTFHHVFAVDLVAPTGHYDNSGLGVSTGHNYWGINPLWAWTYIGDKNSPLPGFEVSSKMMYWYYTVNSADQYQSGQNVSADYLVGQHFGPWGFGANGHYLYQITDDKSHGQTAMDPYTGVATGVDSRYFSVGPAIQYEFPNHGCVTLKWQHDVYAQNYPSGDHFWLKFIWPLPF